MISSSDPLASSNETTPTIQETFKEKSPLFKEFVEKLDTFQTPEEKIAHGLRFMRSSISQEGSPHFREFWEARRAVLPLFRENLNPAIRSNLWNEYVELTVEARRLKEILEEQSSFAMEQIDLAINALVEDLSHFEELLNASGDVQFLETSHTIQEKSGTYNQIQKELNLLNTLASRLNSLRKEIIKTDMRIRFKTKFFRRLSQLGDDIFPKRKELIEKISQEFEKDVEDFMSQQFQDQEILGGSYYALREEIKALQAAAKIFTLSSGAFTRTRLKLSECWDKVKHSEKEYRKEIHEKRQASFEKREYFQIKIDALKNQGLDWEGLNREIQGVLIEMRSVSLARDDVRYLRSELDVLRSPYIAVQEQKAQELKDLEKEKFKEKQERVKEVKKRMEEALRNAENMALEILEAEYKELQIAVKGVDVGRMEKQQLERS
ncbi:MAG: hypothetical protein A3C42_04015, partial [Chlamydiae bacterium RIFCSPHIGHO2_02_FULL_45_9]